MARKRVLEDLIGASQAARIMGVSLKTAQWWFDVGKVEGAVRADGKRLFSKSDAERVAEERSSGRE
jgi:predicted site-specific integrase-resolvase